jgi:flagellar biosynthetic protein FliR
MVISVAQAQMFFLALARILAIIIHVPVLGGRSVPDPIKIGFGLALAMVMLPWQPLPPEADSLSSVAFGFAMGKEVLVGTLAGYAAVLTFGAVQITGNLMSLGSGFEAGHILNPALEDSGSSIDQVLLITAFLLFLVFNGHHAFLLGLQRTFTLIPLNSPLPELEAGPLMRLASGMILAGVQMALPVMGTLLLADLTLGLLAKVAPQVQVFFLGVPLKIGLGLLALSLTIIALAPNLNELFQSLGARMLRLLGA